MSVFNEGDLVWAKMTRCTPWPSMIIKPGSQTPKTPKKGCQWVFFFGSDNYAWIPEDKIKPYQEFREKFIGLYSRSSGFRKAVEKIDEYIKKTEEDPAYTLPLPPEQTEKEKYSGDSEGEFDKLISPKKINKKAPKRRESDQGSGGGRMPGKRPRLSSPSVRNSSPHGSARMSPHSSRISPQSLRISPHRTIRLSPHKSSENGIFSDVGNELLNIPPPPDNPDSSVIEMNFSEMLKTKDIKASSKRFGFLGAGNIGQGVIRNLINSGHKVNLYNRTSSKVDQIKAQADAVREGLVTTYITPCDVMENSDIVFSCVSDPKAAMNNVIGNCSIEDYVRGKGYVEMSGIDPKTSSDISEIIKKAGGRYLEAQVQGSKTEAFMGTLIILAAGDESLFMECQSCFKAMGNNAFYLGKVGYATKTNLVLNIIKGVSLVGLAEALALADRCGISTKDFINIFKVTKKSTYLEEKAEAIANKEFKSVEQALKHMQKDLHLALSLSDSLNHPLLMTATANELYKHARRLGYDEHDVCCIYMRTRH